jgi:hypothetical protein
MVTRGPLERDVDTPLGLWLIKKQFIKNAARSLR